MKIFVTGAAGFIGSKFLREALTRGHIVIGCDSFNDYYSADLKKYRLSQLKIGQYVSIIPIESQEFVEEVVRFKPDAMVHLAAQPGVRYCSVNPMSYINSNVVAFENVINALKKSATTKLIYASSSSVYGPSVSEEFQEKDRGGEVKNLYALTKRLNEDRVSLEGSWLRSIGLRFFSVYGPMGRPDMAYFRLVASALGMGKFNQYGDGYQRRDFTYIDDVTDSILQVLELEVEEKYLNIGGGTPVSLNELMNLVSRIYPDSRMRILEKASNPTESRVTKASTELARKLGLPIPKTNIEDGIERFCEWADSIPRELFSQWVASSK